MVTTVLANFGRAIFRTSGPNPALEKYESLGLNFGTRSWAGPVVTDEDATKIAAVWCAVNLIAPTIAGLPLHVFRHGDETREPLRTAGTAFIWNRPNPEHSRVGFWTTILSHEVLHGNAFIFVRKNDLGGILSMWPVASNRVHVGRFEDGRKYYEIGNLAPMIDYSQGGEIVHVMGMSLDGTVGVSPLRLAAQTLGLTKAAEEYAARLFSQDASPRGLLSTDQDISEDEAKMLEARWARLTSGLSNTGRTRVLGKGVKWQATATTPVDVQVIEERRFQIAEIARIFGVPPHLLGDMEKSTSWGSGLEESNNQFYQSTLLKHINFVEAAINNELLPSDMRYAKFNIDGFLRGTYKQRAEGHRIALAGQPYRTRNEVRLLEELPPLPGGDELPTPLNMGQGGIDNEPDVPPVEEAEEAEARAYANGNGHHPIAEARCPNPKCNHLHGYDVVGARFVCPKCKTPAVFPSLN